jgi:hypothetical protein
MAEAAWPLWIPPLVESHSMPLSFIEGHQYSIKHAIVCVELEKGRFFSGLRLSACNEECRACTAPTVVLGPRLSQVGRVGASALVGWCCEATGFFLLLVRLMQLSSLMPNVKSESKSHYDWRPVSMSSCRSSSGTHYQILFLVWQSMSCPCEAPSPMRGRVCRLSVTVNSNNSIVRISVSLHFTCHTCYDWCTVYTRLLSVQARYSSLDLERSYFWPPPSLSLLYFLYRASPCPILRALAFPWYCMISACCLDNFVI